MEAATALTHKELTAHIRNRIKVAGIKASVRKQAYCGDKVIRVDPVAYEISFTHAEQATIGSIADVNGLTFTMGAKITTANDVHGSGFVFVMPVRN